MSYYFMLWGLKIVTLKIKDSKVLFVTFMSGEIQDALTECTINKYSYKRQTKHWKLNNIYILNIKSVYLPGL